MGRRGGRGRRRAGRLPLGRPPACADRATRITATATTTSSTSRTNVPPPPAETTLRRPGILTAGADRGAADPSGHRRTTIDAVDRQLIDLLRANGRASYAELARQVGLSSPAVHDRVGKLEAAGVITGYHAVVDPPKVGLDVTALVGVIESDSVDDAGVEQALRALPELEDCWRVAGTEDYVAKVRVADMAALEATINAMNRIRGVARTRTTVVLSTKWEGRNG